MAEIMDKESRLKQFGRAVAPNLQRTASDYAPAIDRAYQAGGAPAAAGQTLRGALVDFPVALGDDVARGIQTVAQPVWQGLKSFAMGSPAVTQPAADAVPQAPGGAAPAPAAVATAAPGAPGAAKPDASERFAAALQAASGAPNAINGKAMQLPAGYDPEAEAAQVSAARASFLRNYADVLGGEKESDASATETVTEYDPPPGSVGYAIRQAALRDPRRSALEDAVKKAQDQVQAALAGSSGGKAKYAIAALNAAQSALGDYARGKDHAAADAAQDATQRRGQDINAATAKSELDLRKRGQDLEMSRGAPDAALKQQALAKGGQEAALRKIIADPNATLAQRQQAAETLRQFAGGNLQQPDIKIATQQNPDGTTSTYVVRNGQVGQTVTEEAEFAKQGGKAPKMPKGAVKPHMVNGKQATSGGVPIWLDAEGNQVWDPEAAK